MKYLALLRGINVGGNNIIPMKTLKEAFEKMQFSNVKTYIQSGNVLFESEEKNEEVLLQEIEKMLSKQFHYDAKITLRSHKEIKEVISNIPKEWTSTDDLRCYIAFLIKPLTPPEAIKEIEINEAVDAIATGPGVIYMTTQMSGLTKSKFNKLVGRPLYKQMTIRNLNTTKKLLELLTEEE